MRKAIRWDRRRRGLPPSPSQSELDRKEARRQAYEEWCNQEDELETLEAERLEAEQLEAERAEKEAGGRDLTVYDLIGEKEPTSSAHSESQSQMEQDSDLSLQINELLERVGNLVDVVQHQTTTIQEAVQRQTAAIQQALPSATVNQARIIAGNRVASGAEGRQKD